jgi:hypothetical protein
MKRFFTVLSLLFVVGTALVVSDMMFVNQSSSNTQRSASIKPVSINPNTASLVGLQTIAPKRENELIN